jgi:hypothetical protein
LYSPAGYAPIMCKTNTKRTRRVNCWGTEIIRHRINQMHSLWRELTSRPAQAEAQT